jgi:hypothetical protein
MARPTRADARIDLSELSALIETLRAGGVVRYCKDGLELVLGPPLPSRSKTVGDPKDPNATRRSYYEQMLSRPVGDKELEFLP